jgi:hypothetical protein
MVGDDNGNPVRACVKGGRRTRSSRSRRQASNCAPDPNNEDGLDSKWEVGGRKDADLEMKKANNYGPNPNNEDGFDSKWYVCGQVGRTSGSRPCRHWS